MSVPTFVAVGAKFADIVGGQILWPVGHQAGDVGIMVAETANELAVLSDAQGFVETASSPQGTGTGGGLDSTRLTAWWARATSGSMVGPTIADPGFHLIAAIVVIRGCIASGNPWNVAAGDVLAAGSTAISIPGGVTTADECLILAMAASGRNAANNQYSGWANPDLSGVVEVLDYATTVGNGGTIGAAVGGKIIAGPFGVTTATLANAFHAVQGRLMLALRPPAIVGGSPPNPHRIFGAREAVHRAARW